MPELRSEALTRTPLSAVHESLGATMTDFAGWLMPLRYRSETAEHNAVRTAAGLFDLSHMGELRVTGDEAAAALDYALVSDISAIRPGRAKYTMIVAADGGVIDDLIVYRLDDQDFLVVANASNAVKVAAELTERASGSGLAAQVEDRTSEYALIAIQGPRAPEILAGLTDTDLTELRYYAGYPAVVAGRPVLLARTGYTGEDGFEIFTEPKDAAGLWSALTEAGQGAGLIPAGLAARDSLRLEAGMPLYGNELSRQLTPYDAGLGRVVKLEKASDFVGRAALADKASQPREHVLVGLAGLTRRVPRHGFGVLWNGAPAGMVTSGGHSPTLGRPIAMAYLNADAAKQATDALESGQADGDGRLAIDIRGSAEPAELIPLPFYRRQQRD
ncbi:MAG TPA: glycine cleavage system aminomethyltransferase GcvT [Streptosporangiaceae bacterium]|nr:glycine cleavage system aminomethyltransferase GcvT [Streptosporangiaceae bacterium]